MPSALRVAGASLLLAAGLGVAVWLTAGAAASGGSTPVIAADASFHGGTPVQLTFPTPAGASGTPFMGADALARLSSGKVLVGGYDVVNGKADYAVARLNANGTLDTTFGTNGYATVDPIAGGYNLLYGLVVQSDGKIVLAGSAQGGGAPEIGLARLTAAGSLDSTFGSGGVVLDNSDRSALAVALDSNGRILVTGDGGDVHRYTASGAIDTSFGTGGKSVSAMATGSAILLQSTGKVVIAGTSYVSSVAHATVARYTANGALDASFGTSGVTDVTPTGTSATLQSATFQGSDILVAGSAGSGGGLVARLTSAGALDTSFGTSGRSVTGAAAGGMVTSVLYVPHPIIVVAETDSDEVGGSDSPDDADPRICAATPAYKLIGCVPQGDSETSGGLAAGAMTITANGATIDVSGYTADASHATVGQYIATEPTTTTSSSSSTATTATTRTTTTTTTTSSDVCPGTSHPRPCADLKVSRHGRPVASSDATIVDPFTGKVAGLEKVSDEFKVENLGPDPATGGTITVTFDTAAAATVAGADIPHNQNYVIANSGRCGSSTSAVVTCRVDALAVGASESFLAFTSEDTPVDTYHFRAEVTPTRFDPTLPDLAVDTVQIFQPESKVIGQATRSVQPNRSFEVNGTAVEGGPQGAGHAFAPRATAQPKPALAKVQILVVKVGSAGAAKCFVLASVGPSFKDVRAHDGRCLLSTFLKAKITQRTAAGLNWSFRLPHGLPKGTYRLYSRAVTKGGAVDGSFGRKHHNELEITVG